MSEKHLPYFDLLESLQTAGCPVCSLLENQIRKYLESILYDQVNNVFFRSKLRTDQGFCNRHSHQLTGYKDALGVAIIHRELLQNKLEELGSRRGKGLLSKKKRSRCMVCRLESTSEKRYLEVIVESMKKDEFQKAYTGSAGLCVPHYKKLRTMKRLLPSWLKEHQLQRYTDLLAGLDKFIASYNVSLGDKQPKLTEAEKTIWRQGVAMLFGYQGMP
jgi:hypothetical protein